MLQRKCNCFLNICRKQNLQGVPYIYYSTVTTRKQKNPLTRRSGESNNGIVHKNKLPMQNLNQKRSFWSTGSINVRVKYIPNLLLYRNTVTCRDQICVDTSYLSHVCHKKDVQCYRYSLASNLQMRSKLLTIGKNRTTRGIQWSFQKDKNV